MSSSTFPEIADLRVSYDYGTLDVGDLATTPLEQFTRWFTEASGAGLPEVNAMVLATASMAGVPSARTVLLKQVDARGFVFFTNLESRKSRELAANPAASCVFAWLGMHRQVVVQGSVDPLSRDEVEEYFNSRPRESRLGAWASHQSMVITDRQVLDERFAEVGVQFPAGAPIPAPDFWGGWLLRPQSVEFWQGRISRLHDRLRFEAVGDLSVMNDPVAWRVARLSP